MIAYGWLAWLVLFLAYEIPAAIAEVVYARRGQRRAITLSRNVWRWFGVTEWRRFRTARRVALAVFMLTLSAHFVFASPEAWAIIATGIPVAFVIGYAVLIEDRRARSARWPMDAGDRSALERAYREHAVHVEAFPRFISGMPEANLRRLAAATERVCAEHAEHVRADEEAAHSAARERVCRHIRGQFARHDADTKGGR